MDEAVKYQKMAVKAVRREQPEKLSSFMFDLGQYYYNKGQIDEADNVFQSILKEDDTYQPAMVGLARNCMRRQKYDKGLEWLELAKKYDNDYSQIYRFEMQILKAMGRGKEAIDSAIKYCLTDKDADIDVLTEYIGLGYSYGIAKLKNAFRGTSDMRLPHIMARLHQDHGKYDEAIDCLKIIEYKNGASAPICSEMCLCYYNMGDFPKALAEINKAMELSDTISYISVRADLYRGWGKYNEAIADYMAAMQEHPAEGYYYYGLGWCYELMGNDTEALKYYDEGVKVDSSHAYLALCRGDLLEKMGKITQAEADYRRVLVLDNEPETGSCRQYALHALGRDQDAIEWMDKIIENAPNYAGNWYDKSCLLTRMGRMDDALDALETALEKGFSRLAHMEHDDDMDPLRNLPRYKALIKLYKGRP